MVTEIARLTIKPGQEEAYQQAFASVEGILRAAKGYVDHSLEQCIEDPSRFVLIVHWETYADHVEHFRNSEPYMRFRGATAPYAAQPTEVLHYQRPGS
jgi:heme-degrading monooxygenase HmoA